MLHPDRAFGHRGGPPVPRTMGPWPRIGAGWYDRIWPNLLIEDGGPTLPGQIALHATAIPTPSPTAHLAGHAGASRYVVFRPSLSPSASAHRRATGRNLALDLVGCDRRRRQPGARRRRCCRRSPVAAASIRSASRPWRPRRSSPTCWRPSPVVSARAPLARWPRSACSAPPRCCRCSCCRRRRSWSRPASSSGSACPSSSPFQLRLWGAMYPARLRGRIVGSLGMGRSRRDGDRLVRPAASSPTGSAARPSSRSGGLVGCGLRHRLRGPARTGRVRTAALLGARLRCAPSASGPSSARITLAQGFYGGGLVAAIPLYALVYVDRLDLSLGDVGLIGVLAAVSTTVSFLLWGEVVDRARLDRGAAARRACSASPRWRSTRSRRTSPVLWVAAIAGGAAGASIDVGWAAIVSDHTSMASRSAAVAGMNAITGARGIVAAFAMSALLQLGILDVTSGLLVCTVVDRDRRRAVRPDGRRRRSKRRRQRSGRPDVAAPVGAGRAGRPASV